MMKQMCSAGTLTTCTGENWLFAYTADDERILSYRPAGGAFHTALRDLDGKILREYKTELGGWPAFEDYIYRGRTPLASIHPTEGTRYFGTDHLGTPRFVFSPSGPTLLATHTYYPLGEEATSASQDTQQLKFTGHERDMLNTPTATADDTDNMHARQFSLQLGRFMSTDPVRGDPHRPQSFNLYSYVIGNPLKYTDPFGLNMASCDVAMGPCPQSIAPYTEVESIDVTGSFGPPAPPAPFGPGAPGYSAWLWLLFNGGPSIGTGPSESGGGWLGEQGASVPEVQSESRGFSECFSGNRASSALVSLGLVDEGGAAHAAAEFVEVGSEISLGADLLATARKNFGRTAFLGGSTNRYASGMNWGFRRFSQTLGSPLLQGRLVAIGTRATPVLAVTGAFTGAYNATIAVRCAAGNL